MRKLTKVLLTALLSVAVFFLLPCAFGRSASGGGVNWGISIAQNKPQRPDQPYKPPRPENKEDIGRRPEVPPPPGVPDGMMESPKVREEMKRHGEVLKGLSGQMKTLQEKIRKELEPKGGRPQTPPPEPPDKQGNPEEPGPGPLPPGQPGIPPEGQPDEDPLKILEPYRAEAQQIADKITSELVTHCQNLVRIVTGEKENIKNALTDKILLPPPPPPRQGKPGEQGPPDRPDRPDKGGRPEPPPDRPDNPDDSDR